MRVNLQNRNIRYLFAGGGTGGHLFPAIAIADEIQKLQPGAEILFVGTKNKIEARVVPQKGYNFRAIWISGFRRSFQIQNIIFPLKVIVAIIQSLIIIMKFKPDIVIGTGGYICAPILYAASLLRIQTVIHESNSYPGAVTRLLANRVSKVFLTFTETKKWLKRSDNTEVVGNPTRYMDNIDRMDAIKTLKLEENKKTILVFGGSLGAASINNAILLIVEKLIQKNVQIIWQTGETEYDRIEKQLAQNNLFTPACIKLEKFIDRMDYAYAAADLVVCRAGATTIAELTRLGKPAILVPYPRAAANHQTLNAAVLVNKGAAIMIADDNLTNRIEEVVLSTLDNDDVRSRMSQESKLLGVPQAGLNIAKKIIDMVK
jgi:UDP-N-acetylglucosamine--N-acetylmuramyl-(pentapeptide) pyrophosphoryl-undecaprenol N-acetylglucosamine transferase